MQDGNDECKYIYCAPISDSPCDVQIWLGRCAVRPLWQNLLENLSEIWDFRSFAAMSVMNDVLTCYVLSLYRLAAVAHSAQCAHAKERVKSNRQLKFSCCFSTCANMQAPATQAMRLAAAAFQTQQAAPHSDEQCRFCSTHKPHMYARTHIMTISADICSLLFAF